MNKRLLVLGGVFAVLWVSAACQPAAPQAPDFLLPPMGDDVRMEVIEWHYFPTSHLYKFQYSENRKDPCDFNAAAMVDVKNVVQIGYNGHCEPFGGRTVYVVRLRHDWDK